MIRVLFVSNEDHSVGGASFSLLNLIHGIKTEVEPIVLCRSEGQVADLFRSDGVDVQILNFQRATFGGRWWRYPIHAAHVLFDRWRCVSKARKLFADISVVHTNSSTIDIGLYIARALGVPHVWHIREYMDLDFGMKPFVGFSLFKRKLLSSDAVIAISKGVYNHFSLSEHPCAFWIHDAVRPASEACLVKEKSPYYLFCAATISEGKNPVDAIDGMARSGLKGYKLIMVGRCQDTMRANLEMRASKQGVDLDILPFVSDIKPLMNRATAFLMTSNCEGLGRVTIEAMFYGCPVIGRASGGTMEFIENGVDGYLFNSVDELSSHIRTVADEFPLGVVQAAQKKAVQAFSEEEYGKKIMQIYDSLL